MSTPLSPHISTRIRLYALVIYTRRFLFIKETPTLLSDFCVNLTVSQTKEFIMKKIAIVLLLILSINAQKYDYDFENFLVTAHGGGPRCIGLLLEEMGCPRCLSS